MRKVLLLSAAAVLVSAAPSQSSAQVLLSPAVKQDVQCFVLYAIGIDMAKSDKDRQGAMMAMMYYVGKLTVGAPNVDLVKAIRQDPSSYYVNVHSTAFPAGAVRGQLGD